MKKSLEDSSRHTTNKIVTKYLKRIDKVIIDIVNWWFLLEIANTTPIWD
jgi:hypothetical protein